MSLFPSVSRVDRIVFARHLSVMLRSGVPILEALRSLGQESGGSFRKILHAIGEEVANGSFLYQAIERKGEFSSFFVNLVKVGEMSGTLAGSLEFLAERLAQERAFRKKIIGIALYPLVILLIAGCVAGFVSVFVFPKLISLYDSFHTELPASTQMLLSTASFLQAHGVASLSALLCIAVAFRALVSLPAVKPHWHAAVLAIPVVGPLVRDIALASLFRDLGVLVKRGLPIEESLRVEEEMARNEVIRRYARQLRTAVSQGRRIGDELGNGSYRYFPRIGISIISSGERTGKIDDSFLYLADFLEDEVDTATKNLSTLLEPLLIVIMAALVGFVAFSVIMPMYSLTGSIHR